MTPRSRSRECRSGRILAIDPGEKRIGVAAADLHTRVAIPLTTIEPGADPVQAVARVAEEEAAEAIVVGLALSLSGALGPQAQRAQSLADALARRLDIPVHVWDERLTSVEAQRRLPRLDGRASARDKRSPRGKRRRGDVDALAAAIILQAFLDSQRRRASG
jgi:putative Holliday junction resolvase